MIYLTYSLLARSRNEYDELAAEFYYCPIQLTPDEQRVMVHWLHARDWRKVPPGAQIAPMQLNDEPKRISDDTPTMDPVPTPVVVTEEMVEAAAAVCAALRAQDTISSIRAM